MAIPEETVIHVVGECPELDGPRARILAARNRKIRGCPIDPSPRRITIWVIRQDPQRGERADVVRAAAEFAADLVERRQEALRSLQLWRE